MIRKTNFILYSLITSIIVLISCSGEKSDELFYEIVTPSDKIFAFQDLKNIGFKKSREYNVSDLEGATEAWYGFWGEDEYSRKDYEIRFYSSHQNAVSLGEENIIDYTACRVSGASCVTPPTCGGDGYCPEIAFSSYIIIHY